MELAGLTTPGGGRVEFGNGTLLLNLGNDRYRRADGIAFAKFTQTVPIGWLAPGGALRFTGGRFLATAINLGTFRYGYLGSTDDVAWGSIGYYSEAPAPPPGQSRFYFHNDIASLRANTWQHLPMAPQHNTAIPGATAAAYTIASVTAASAGSYTVAIANAVNATTSVAFVEVSEMP